MRIVLSVFVFVGLTGVLFGMHEADHRFTVLGYVRDAQGEGRAEVVVTIEHKGGVKQQTKTNSSGYYESVFHLHDANLGDEMIITVGAEVKRVVTAFDVEDKHSVREGRVDFGVPAKNNPLAFWLPIGGLLVCIVVALFLMKKKKRSLKEGGVPRERKRKKLG